MKRVEIIVANLANFTFISKVVCCRGSEGVYTRMWELVKTVNGEGKKAYYEQFHLLPQLFQKSSGAEGSQGIYVGKH